MSDFNETVVFQHTVSGTLDPAAGAFLYPVPFPAELISVHAKVGTAPASQSILVDVNKNGTTIYTNQAKRLAIAATATAGVSVADVALANGTNYIYTPAPGQSPLATFAAGDTVSVDVDQVGSGTKGANLAVTLTFQKK